MLPYRKYHKDDIYARMAIEEVDAYTHGTRSVAGDDDAASSFADDDAMSVASSIHRKTRPKQGFQ